MDLDLGKPDRTRIRNLDFVKTDIPRLSGIRTTQHNGRVRGRQARDPPPAGGAGGRQLTGRGAHKPQEDRREAARGGSRISSGRILY